MFDLYDGEGKVSRVKILRLSFEKEQGKPRMCIIHYFYQATIFQKLANQP